MIRCSVGVDAVNSLHVAGGVCRMRTAWEMEWSTTSNL